PDRPLQHPARAVQPDPRPAPGWRRDPPVVRLAPDGLAAPAVLRTVRFLPADPPDPADLRRRIDPGPGPLPDHGIGVWRPGGLTRPARSGGTSERAWRRPSGRRSPPGSRLPSSRSSMRCTSRTGDTAWTSSA